MARCFSTVRTAPSTHKAVKREIEIDREVPKITEIFMPDDLEDMSSLSKVQGGGLVE